MPNRAIGRPPKYRGCGVYVVECSMECGRFYVGSTLDLYVRESLHFSRLRRGLGPRKLQQAWNKFGADCFSFKVLEFCAPEYRHEIEQRFISELQAATVGYNSSPRSGVARGFRWSRESIEKRSATVKGRKMHPSTRVALEKCRSERMPEIAKKISNGMKLAWARKKSTTTAISG